MNYIALNYRRLTVYYDRIQRISYWSIRKILFQEVCYLYAKRIYFWFGNGIAFDFYADENFSNIFNIEIMLLRNILSSNSYITLFDNSLFDIIFIIQLLTFSIPLDICFSDYCLRVFQIPVDVPLP